MNYLVSVLPDSPTQNSPTLYVINKCSSDNDAMMIALAADGGYSDKAPITPELANQYCKIIKKTRTRINISKYAHQLTEFDSNYFCPQDSYLYDIKDEDELSRILATWAFDQNFGVNSSSWKLMEKIADCFGVDMKDKVLYNLFHRKHDT